jgi:hypothetical protein
VAHLRARFWKGFFRLAGLSTPRIEVSGYLSRKSRIYFSPNLFAARRFILKQAERCSPLAYQMSMSKSAIQSGNFQRCDIAVMERSIVDKPIITMGKVEPNQTKGRIRYGFGPRF